MGEEMIIDVFPDGTQTIEVNGVVGPKCAEITKFLTDQGKIVTQTKKPEFNKTQQVVQQQQYIRR